MVREEDTSAAICLIGREPGLENARNDRRKSGEARDSAGLLRS
jgi:hypothetical protein